MINIDIEIDSAEISDVFATFFHSRWLIDFDALAEPGILGRILQWAFNGSEASDACSPTRMPGAHRIRGTWIWIGTSGRILRIELC